MPKFNVQSKWLRQQRNVEVGEVVLVMDDQTPRAHWPLGRVTKSYLGKDAVVRVVDVRVGGKVYKRSVHRLVPLEV